MKWFIDLSLVNLRPQLCLWLKRSPFWIGGWGVLPSTVHSRKHLIELLTLPLRWDVPVEKPLAQALILGPTGPTLLVGQMSCNAGSLYTAPGHLVTLRGPPRSSARTSIAIIYTFSL